MLELSFVGPDASAVLQAVLKGEADVLVDSKLVGRLRLQHGATDWISKPSPNEFHRLVELSRPGILVLVVGFSLRDGVARAQSVHLRADPAGVVVAPPALMQRDIFGATLLLATARQVRVYAICGDTLWLVGDVAWDATCPARVRMRLQVSLDVKSQTQVSLSLPEAGGDLPEFEMEVLEAWNDKMRVRPTTPHPDLAKWLLLLHGVLTVRDGDPGKALENHGQGIFKAVPPGVLDLNVVHRTNFAKTQLQLHGEGLGATFLSRDGSEEYTVTLSGGPDGRYLLHGLSHANWSGDVARTDNPGDVHRTRARAHMLLALALDLAGRPGRELFGFANRKERFLDLFVGLVARGASGRSPPPCGQVFFHKIDLTKVAGETELEGLLQGEAVPSWLVKQFGDGEDAEGQVALALDFHRSDHARPQSRRRVFYTEEAALVVEQGPLGLSPLGIGDRAHFYVRRSLELCPVRRGELFASFLCSASVQAYVKADGRSFLAWFEFGEPGTWIPSRLCLNGQNEYERSTFGFVFDSQRVSLWLSWLRAIA